MNWSDFFTYDAHSGALVWKVKLHGRGCVVGNEAGTIDHHGYRVVTVAQKKYKAHRIVWEMNNGPIPHGKCIDHIDGNCSNNNMENLRLVSLSENQRNSRLPRNNQLGVHGVQPRKRGYAVQCAGVYIGFYNDFFEACCARMSAERRMGFHPNHGRKVQ